LCAVCCWQVQEDSGRGLLQVLLSRFACCNCRRRILRFVRSWIIRRHHWINDLLELYQRDVPRKSGCYHVPGLSDRHLCQFGVGCWAEKLDCMLPVCWRQVFQCDRCYKCKRLCRLRASNLCFGGIEPMHRVPSWKVRKLPGFSRIASGVLPALQPGKSLEQRKRTLRNNVRRVPRRYHCHVVQIRLVCTTQFPAHASSHAQACARENHLMDGFVLDRFVCLEGRADGLQGLPHWYLCIVG